jgi:hypothetical protein
VNNQKRSRKLAERRERQAKLEARHQPRAKDVPVEVLRRLVTDATHRVVTEHTGTDGLGHCMGYALVGMYVARHAFGREFFAQAGSLYLHPDPDDEAFTVAFESHRRGVGSGEFHCWIAATGRGGALEVADLSARHYARMATDFPRVEDFGAPRVWKREPPPDYLWLEVPQGAPWPLPWARLATDREACERLYREMMGQRETVKRLVVRATRIFEEGLAAECGRRG